MKSTFRDQNLTSLVFQRNIFAFTSLLLSVCTVTMSIFLFSKSERIVVVPPTTDREFWIDRDSVSNTYLEQFGLFLGQQLLGKTPQSAPTQRTVVLRHTDPTYYGVLRKKLVEEEEMLMKQNISYSFFPVDISTNSERLTVTLVGDRLSFVGANQIQNRRERYTFGFSYSGSRLLLDSIVEGDNS